MRVWFCALVSAGGGILVAMTILLWEIEQAKVGRPECDYPAVAALEAPFGSWFCAEPLASGR